jgi:hypothetical protein
VERAGGPDRHMRSGPPASGDCLRPGGEGAMKRDGDARFPHYARERLWRPSMQVAWHVSTEVQVSGSPDIA